jgi:hypothetical protein
MSPAGMATVRLPITSAAVPSAISSSTPDNEGKRMGMKRMRYSPSQM